MELTKRRVSSILNMVLLIGKIREKRRILYTKKYKKNLHKVKKVLAIFMCFLYNKKAVTR